MAAAGVMFEIGAILLAAAQNYIMLIIGRCFLGVAVRRACIAWFQSRSWFKQHMAAREWLFCNAVCRSRLPASQSQCTHR